MEEDLGARFNHKGKRIYKSKRDTKQSYNRNNARNRDQYGIAKATGKAVDISADQAFQYWEENYHDNHYEDNVVQNIDKPKKEELLSLDEFNKLKDNLTEEAVKFYKEYYKLEQALQDAHHVQS